MGRNIQLSSAKRGGPDIAPGKHPTAQRVFHETGVVLCSQCGQDLDWTESSPAEMYGADLPRMIDNPHVWFVCEPCLNAMPDVPRGLFTAVDAQGNESTVEIVKDE